MAETGMTRRGGAWSGWITFAAVLLTVLGVLNLLEGLVALMRNQVTFIDGDSLVVVDLTGLGIVMIIFGVLLTLCGIGLFSRNPVARVAAIVVVGLHALAQIGSLGAYPVWSLLMITLDVIVLFALTVHWSPRELETMLPPPGGVHRASASADRDQQAREAGAFPMNQPRPGAHTAPADVPSSYQQQQPAPPAAGPYPPAHSSAPTSGHGAGAI
jgi:hypothetical protein